VTRWSFDPLTVALLVTAAIAYQRAGAAAAARRPGRRVAFVRRGAFYAALAVTAVALLSPVHTYAGERLLVHMAQHLLLTFVAAPLALLGAPLTVAAHALAPNRRRTLRAVQRGRLVAVLTHPLVAWTQFAVLMWSVHLSGFFELAATNDLVHAIEHALFLGSALLFWWPVLGELDGRPRLTYPLRLLYVALAMPQNTFLAVTIVSAGGVLYAHYPSRADQRQAGGLMWVAGDLVLLAIVLLLTAAWARDDELTNRRRERIEDERERLGAQTRRS
jgi:putative copper resistance protein D